MLRPGVRAFQGAEGHLEFGVRPRGRQRGVHRYDREAVSEESIGTTARPSATRARPRP